MFAFVASHLLSTIRSHSSAVAELISIIKRPEEIHTEVQGVISSPHLDTKLLYYVSRRWSLYLIRRVDALVSEVLEAPGANIPFTLEPILLELEGECYVVLILLGPL